MIKTHTFCGRRYKIVVADLIEGVTDVPYDPDDDLEMMILSGKDLRAFHSAFHESLEGSGFCDACMHNKDGTYRTWDAAKFLWRWILDRKPR